MTDRGAEQQAAADAAVEYVLELLAKHDADAAGRPFVVRLGTGPTAARFIDSLADRLAGKPKLLAIPTSERSKRQARKRGKIGRAHV